MFFVPPSFADQETPRQSYQEAHERLHGLVTIGAAKDRRTQSRQTQRGDIQGAWAPVETPWRGRSTAVHRRGREAEAASSKGKRMNDSNDWIKLNPLLSLLAQCYFCYRYRNTRTISTNRERSSSRTSEVTSLEVGGRRIPMRQGNPINPGCRKRQKRPRRQKSRRQRSLAKANCSWPRWNKAARPPLNWGSRGPPPPLLKSHHTNNTSTSFLSTMDNPSTIFPLATLNQVFVLFQSVLNMN